MKQPGLCAVRELLHAALTGSHSWALTVSVALCVGQGPAHQPGCGEVLQAAQLRGQQAHRLALHIGLLHLPVFPQVWTHPGPAFTPLSYALFWSLASTLQLLRWTFVLSGLCTPMGFQPWGCWGAQCWPPNLCESQGR